MALSTHLCEYILSHYTSSPYIVGVIGSGGKTSTIEFLASSLSKRGKRVLVITTTHMGHPETHKYPFKTYIVKNEGEEIGQELLSHQVLLIASLKGEKLGPIGEAQYNALLLYYDIILIEADGARGKNLKYHRDNEPVLISPMHLLIKVIGLSSLEHLVEEELHNAELFFLEDKGEKRIVDSELIHYLAFSKKGLAVEKEHEKSILLYNQSDAITTSQLSTIIETGTPYFDNVSYPIIVGSIYSDTIECIYNKEE